MPFLVIVIAFSVLVLPFLISGSQKNTLKDHVSFVSAKSDSGSGRCSSLLDYVLRAQTNIPIAPIYKLTASEFQFAKQVIEYVSSTVSEAYLSNRLEASRAKSSISSEEFFFVCLYDHLWRHKGNTICGKDLYNNYVEYTDQRGSHKKKCQLSDEGLVYYKLLHIAASYCHPRPRVNSVELGLMIDTYEIEHYRSVILSRSIDRNV